MMLNRRYFLQGLAGLYASSMLNACKSNGSTPNRPVVISTWSPNTKANAAAFDILFSGGNALNAVHEGVQVPEADPEDQSVGYGGLPDRDGKVTVDACIMDHLGNCGAVFALEHILHPISVARMVMEKTPHIQLAGEGALQFALEMGFEKTNLLTSVSEEAWKKWLKEAQYNPTTTVNNILETIKNQHDTIGMLALGKDGNLAGACSTSGMAYKIRGRVGDSPIIGAGLYVDNEVGAASATGVGEEIVRICGSHTIVEFMRQGFSPEEACKKTLERLVKLRGKENLKLLQVGLIALDTKGNYGCYALNKDFTMAVQDSAGAKVVEAESLF
jgi:N4-(beta-N-acetylglucosaminyl)-L-asparaginase